MNIKIYCTKEEIKLINKFKNNINFLKYFNKSINILNSQERKIFDYFINKNEIIEEIDSLEDYKLYFNYFLDKFEDFLYEYLSRKIKTKIDLYIINQFYVN